MLTSIRAITDEHKLAPLVIVHGEKLHANTLYERDMAEHWDDVMVPLLTQYAQSEALELAKVDTPTNASDVLKTSYAQLDEQVAYYEKAMENPELTVDELNELAEGLDAVLATRAALKDVADNLGKNTALVNVGLLAHRQKQGLLIAALLDLAEKHGGEVVQTPHGMLSPQSLLTFLEQQETAGHIEFVSADYRQKLFGYVYSLSPDTSK